MSAESDLANERAVVASVMTSADGVLPAIAKIGIAAEWFDDPRCRVAMRVALALWRERRSGIDAVTILTERKRLGGGRGGEGDDAGVELDFAWVESVIADLGAAATVEYYAANVRDAYVRRMAREMLPDFVRSMQESPGFALTDIRRKFDALQDVLSHGGAFDIRSKALDAFMGVAEDAHKVVMVDGGGKGRYCPGMRLPWNVLTNAYMGLGPGLHIVSGRPSAGKTAFVNNLLRFWLDELKVAGGVNSLDMAPAALISRNVAELSGVSLSKANFGFTRENEMEALRRARLRVDAWPMALAVIRDLDEFRSWVTIGVERHGWKFVVVDFIQLLTFRGASRMTVDDRTAHISGTVKALALELGVPIVALSQLNRECEREGGRAPKPSDLRGGGSLEQDAASVLMISRDEEVEARWKDCPPTQMTPFGDNEAVQRYLAKSLRPVWVDLAKNQQGPTAKYPFVFFRNYFRFRLADYLAQTEIEDLGRGKTVRSDWPKFARILGDWRSEELNDAALARSGGLVTAYNDGDE